MGMRDGRRSEGAEAGYEHVAWPLAVRGEWLVADHAGGINPRNYVL